MFRFGFVSREMSVGMATKHGRDVSSNARTVGLGWLTVLSHLPTPTGMWSKSDCASCSLTGPTSA